MPPLDIIGVTIGCDSYDAHHHPSPPITTRHRYVVALARRFQQIQVVSARFTPSPWRRIRVPWWSNNATRGGFHSHGGYPWKIHGKSQEWLVYFEDPMTNIDKLRMIKMGTPHLNVNGKPPNIAPRVLISLQRSMLMFIQWNLASWKLHRLLWWISQL